MSGAMWSIAEERSELSNSFVSSASSIPSLEVDETYTQKVRQRLKSQIRNRRKWDQKLNKGLKEIENDVEILKNSYVEQCSHEELIEDKIDSIIKVNIINNLFMF